MTVDAQIETLEAKGLIRLATVRPELEYLFRHALVQDAAYGSLLKQERRELHARVGDALEALYPDRRGELAAVLAMHFEAAGDTRRAVDYHVAAGEYGQQRNAIREAAAAFDRAAELLPPPSPDEDDAARRRRVVIELGRAQAGYSFRSTEAVLAHLESIVPQAATLEDPELEARVHMLIALGQLQGGTPADSPAVQPSLRRIEEIGEQIGDPSLRALPLALVGMNQIFGGSLRQGVEALREAVPLLDSRHDSIGVAFARGALAIGLAELGEFDEAEEASRHATELAKRADVIAQLDALIAESIVRSMRGQLEETVPIAQSCVDLADQTGASACLMASAWVLGDAFHRLGRFAEARSILQRGSDVAGVVDRKVWRPTLTAWLGSTAAALGEPTTANLDDALATARSINNRLGEAGILTKRAESAAARGDLEAALADFETSAGLLEAEGARPSLARTLQSWGDALRSMGRVDEADPILRRSLALFEELGLEREAGAVRTTLSVGGSPIAFG